MGETFSSPPGKNNSFFRIIQLQTKISESKNESEIAKWNEKIADICIEMELKSIAVDFYLKALVITVTTWVDMTRVPNTRNILMQWNLNY